MRTVGLFILLLGVWGRHLDEQFGPGQNLVQCSTRLLNSGINHRPASQENDVPSGCDLSLQWYQGRSDQTFSTVSFERGSESPEQERRTATTVVKFTFRSLDIEGIRPDYRLVYNGLNYDILDILDFGRNDFTTIKAEKKF